MSSEMLRVTLDTDVLVEFWKGHDKAATTKTLLDLAQSGLVDLEVWPETPILPKPSFS